MEKSKQPSFSLQSSLTRDTYRMQETLYKKDKTKNLIIQHQNNPIDKLHPSILEEEDFIYTLNLFQKIQKNQLDIPKHSNPKLINRVIHYFYFLEVKPLPFQETFDLLDLANFFQIKNLVEKLLSYLYENANSLKKAISIRIALFPIMKRSYFKFLDSIKEVFDKCEDYLLRQNCIEEFLSFYSHHYFAFTQDSDVEKDLFNQLRLMKQHNIDGIHLLKFVTLFKDRLLLQKNENDIQFDFKAYFEKILKKYIKLADIEERYLNKAFERLGLDADDFKLNIANEKITDLEMRECQSKETISMLQTQITHVQKM